MKVVLDTSAAVKLILGKDDTNEFGNILEQADLVLAPELFIAESTNTYWKYHRSNNLAAERCEALIEQTLGLIDDFVSASLMYQEAFAVATQTDLSVYDALYLVLARRKNALLLTADKKLNEITTKLNIKTIPQ